MPSTFATILLNLGEHEAWPYLLENCMSTFKALLKDTQQLLRKLAFAAFFLRAKGNQCICQYFSVQVM